MIKISNLTKEYISKNNENSIVALDNISFTLPNKGLVFIVGKSGSGKSTLLNLIGGLDVSTSGSINVDGNEITSFDENKLEDYRNSYLGFVFQDYYHFKAKLILQPTSPAAYAKLSRIPKLLFTFFCVLFFS